MKLGTISGILLFAACTSGPGGMSNGSDPGVDAAVGSSADAAPGGDGAGSDFANLHGPYFETSMFWNRDVSAVAKSANSDSIITALRGAGGWGNGNKIAIDFTIDVLTANAATPHQTFTPTSDFFSPDCDHVELPVPPNGNIEGETGYQCTTGGDCHLLVYDTSAKKLYEMWRADITDPLTPSSFQGGCLAVWNTSQTYTDTLRGDQCTSADAAGFPISPLLFTADEVAAGEIKHAIRYILPNNRVRRGFVRPATHGTSTTGGSSAPAYGSHLRLRADFPIDSLPSEGAKVVARAMQKYGMYHADGGNIALTAQSDRHTTAKWAGLLDSHDLQALRVEDFEVIDHGSMISLTDNCAR
jgi:hypothetical protein